MCVTKDILSLLLEELIMVQGMSHPILLYNFHLQIDSFVIVALEILVFATNNAHRQINDLKLIV